MGSRIYVTRALDDTKGLGVIVHTYVIFLADSDHNQLSMENT